MIGLVLDDARGKIVRRAARSCRRRDPARVTLIARARGTRPRMSGMLRQPSQSSTISVPTGVITGLMNTIGSLSGDNGSSFVRRDGRHEDAQPFVNLRRRQADAVVLVHGVDHVVDQLLHRRLLQLGAFDLLRARAEDRMAHAGDFQERHSDDYVDRAKGRLR